MRLYTILLYFLQTTLHVSDGTFIHHQEHIQTVITTSGTGQTVICYRPLTWRIRNCQFDSSTSVEGSKLRFDQRQMLQLQFECAPDDGWGYHPKHVELSAENIIILYIVTSCWTIIDNFYHILIIETGPRAYRAPCSLGIVGPFLGGKAAEARSWSRDHSCAEVNEWTKPYFHSPIYIHDVHMDL